MGLIVVSSIAVHCCNVGLYIDVGPPGPAAGLFEVAGVECGGGRGGFEVADVKCGGGELGGGRSEAGWEGLGAGDYAAGPAVTADGTPGSVLVQSGEGELVLKEL